MKINGPGQPPVPGVSGQEAPVGPEKGRGAGPAGGVAPGEEARKTGQSFAQTVSATAAAQPAAPSGVARPGGIAVHDLAAALRSGQLDARSAVDKVIDRIVTAQLGPDAPTQVRDKVQAALQDALDDDPTLAEKLRGL
jgi:hypothetical protein